MNELLKQFSQEIAERFSKALERNGVKELIRDTKAAAETDVGTFEVVISTDNQDRQGDVIDQSGWDLSHFKKNPIVLWAHDYESLPIGVCDEINQQGKQLIAKGRFAPSEANPFAQQVRKLYDLGIVRATSVGFIPRESQKNVITKAELLEFSFVPVPANPYALSLAQAKAIDLDLNMIRAKGIEVKTEDGGEVDEAKPPKEETAALETKGEVQDMLDARENMNWNDLERKYSYMDRVFEIVGALCSVYLDDRVPVDRFSELLKETAALLQAYAENPAVEFIGDGEIVKATKEGRTDFAAVLSRRKNLTVTKSGRILSEKNRKLIGDTVAALQQTTAALQELHEATEPQGDGEEKRIAPPKKRSNDAGFDEKTLNEFVHARQVLRRVSTSISEALADFNRNARAIKK